MNKYPEYHIINLDKLTYAGNLANLKDIEDKPNYTFVKGDICNFDLMLKLMQDYKVDGIIHLAAESHVDRSIKDPFTFAQTNVMGTLSLLQAAKIYWESLPEGYEGKRFYHISTDEGIGALQMTHPEITPAPFTAKAFSGKNHEAYAEEFFLETTKYNPHSPYSASKANSDHFVRAFHDTYGMPTIVTNCSNNYHVDRSIKDPFTFAQTNVMGTLSLLQAAKIYWESLPEGYEGKRFYHISTDEVYGALKMTHPEGIPAPFTTKASSGKNHEAYGEEFFLETTKYNPHSPYSASNASSYHFVRAFHYTYGIPTIVTN